MWVIIDHTTAVSANPKCACMALQDMFGRPRRTDEEVAHIPRRVLFMRDPMERFYSAYCYFCMVRDKGGEYKPLGKGKPDNYEDFVDRTFEIRDRHWDPQVANCLAYTEVMGWRELPAFVQKVSGRPMVHTNSSPKYPYDSCYRRDELTARYAADYDMINTMPVAQRPRAA